jgi:hypothetical protein
MWRLPSDISMTDFATLFTSTFSFVKMRVKEIGFKLVAISLSLVTFA